MTGMFYEPTLHRIYYTVSGDARLFYRYFTPESEVVGALTFTADSGGVSFASAAGPHPGRRQARLRVERRHPALGGLQRWPGHRLPGRR